jgi:hypothetical protein
MAYGRGDLSEPYDLCPGGEMFRPLLGLAILACVVGAVGCRSDENPPPRAAGSSAPGSPTPTPAAAPCPSAKEVVAAMAARGWTDFRVTSPIVCDGGWATTTVQLTKMASDPARTVLRRVDGRWHAVTYGTDGLCGARGMRPAPAHIKKALEPYC